MDGGKNLMLRLIKVLNVVLMAIPFHIVWVMFCSRYAAIPYGFKGNCAVTALFVLLYIILGRTYEGFLVSYFRISQMVYSQGLALFLSNMVMFLVACLLGKRFVPLVLPFLMVFAVQLCLSCLWSVLAYKWYFATHPPKKTMIVYDMRKGIERLIHKYDFDKKFQVETVLPVGECLEDLSQLDRYELVFLSGVHSHDRNIILKYCVEHNVMAMVVPRVGDVLMSGAHKMHLFYLPVLRVERYNPPVEFVVIKRLCDLLLSGLALVLLSPVMLVTALAIKMTDGGPVFYRQVRLTQDGREFEMLKFRSMKVNAESDGVARLSSGAEDDRVTRVGRVIRPCRIDELPQLLNILKGEMSIVGPRPERPEIAAQYEAEMPEFRLRLQAKAGLTGYAQIYGKYNTTPYDKLQMDLMYIAHPSIIDDFCIIFATVKILFVPESTEGVETGSTATKNDKKNRNEDDNK